MIIGVPKEIKTDEYRVAMIPVGVEELTRAASVDADALYETAPDEAGWLKKRQKE